MSQTRCCGLVYSVYRGNKRVQVQVRGRMKETQKQTENVSGPCVDPPPVKNNLNSWLPEINCSLLYLSCGGEQSKASGSENSHRLKHSWTLSRAKLGGSVWSKKEKNKLVCDTARKTLTLLPGQNLHLEQEGGNKRQQDLCVSLRSHFTPTNHRFWLCASVRPDWSWQVHLCYVRCHIHVHVFTWKYLSGGAL